MGNNVKVREGKSEVMVYINKFMPDELSALKEASRLLQKEIIRYESDHSRSFHRNEHGDIL